MNICCFLLASKQPMADRWWPLCLGLLLFRCLDSLLVRTFFSPDEYWQGPEVAHRLVFGTGIL